MFQRLTYQDRLKVEALYNAGASAITIASAIGKHRSTVYREIKRGTYEHIIGKTYQTVIRYSADIAEADYQSHFSALGAPLKIGNDHRLAQYIETKIADEGYSPDAVIGEIKALDLPFTRISTTTLYSYINKGIFLRITNKSLLRKGKRKVRKYEKIHRDPRPCKGTSIESRPSVINDRERFGDWEMDLVIGKTSGDEALLTMTERYSRYEIIRRVKNKQAVTIVAALEKLKSEFGSAFSSMFKTITCDNGPEFRLYEEIEALGPKLFYAHPYSSWERGTNENHNGIIRRFIPKFTAIRDYDDSVLSFVADRMNRLPRKILGYRTPAEIFNNFLSECRETT